MNTSETIGELAAALSKAQGAMTGAKKASANPFFKSKYSDLSQVMEAISEPFSDNGLSFVQSPGFDGERITVTTRIMHSSGEWIEGTTVLPPTKNDAQGYGSAITYAKRYGLQAMAGVPSVDDDGNDAVKHASSDRPKKTPKYPQQQFAENISKWRDLIESGKRTADQIIAMVSSKYTMTDDQIAAVRADVKTGEIDDHADFYADYDNAQEQAQ